MPAAGIRGFRDRLCLRAGHRQIGGDGGIRTLDRALQPYNGLANRRLQPLGHVSGEADMPDAAACRKRPICDRRIPGQFARPFAWRHAVHHHDRELWPAGSCLARRLRPKTSARRFAFRAPLAADNRSLYSAAAWIGLIQGEADSTPAPLRPANEVPAGNGGTCCSPYGNQASEAPPIRRVPWQKLGHWRFRRRRCDGASPHECFETE